MAGAPAVSPIPGASGYAQADVLANTAYNNALAHINQNRLNTLTQYGYTGAVDPHSGVVSNVRVDPYALHGQLQDLLHAQALEDMHADQGAEDRGLVGGLAHQARSELHFQHGSQDAQLGTTLTGALSDLQDQQQTAGESRDAALSSAEWDALQAQLAAQGNDTLEQLLNPGGNYSDGSGSGSGSGTTSYKPGKSTTATGGRAPTYRGRRDFARTARARAHKTIINRRRPGRQDQ